MSEYVTFYLYHKEEFLEIGSFSRNSFMYNSVGEFIRYGKCALLTEKLITDIVQDLMETKEIFQKTAEQRRDRINFIKECNNSLDEKMDMLIDVQQTVKENEEDLCEIERASQFLHFINMLVKNSSYTSLENVGLYCAHECAPYIENESEE